METVLKSFIDTAVPEVRRAIFHHADNTLHRIGHHDHEIAVDVVLSKSDDMTTDDVVMAIESVLAEHLMSAISEYGIGIKTPNIAILPSILMGMHDLLSFEDGQRLLDIIDENESSEYILSLLLCEIYNYDISDYDGIFEYVNHQVIDSLERNLQQSIELEEMDQEPEDVDDEVAFNPETQHHGPEFIKRFLLRHPNPEFESLLEQGYRLGYRYDTYVEKLIAPKENIGVEELALQYMTAALASGETINQAVRMSGFRLDDLVSDTSIVQQALQRVRRYLDEV